MAAKSLGFRINNRLLLENNGNSYHLNPEVMFGVSRKIMIHADLFFGTRPRELTNLNKEFDFDGGSIYLKYRVYSQDEVHSHFRIAAYARLSSSNAYIKQPAIDLHGNNTGYESGLIATKLINKVALSASVSFLHATDNGTKKFGYGNSRNAIDYTLSVGKLMLPKEYTDYKQTNLNIMIEMLGQYNTGVRQSFLDIAPSIQFIILSKMRVDLGYRFPLTQSLFRTDKSSFLLRLEYNIFNVFK